MKGMLAPKFREVDLGRVEVRQVYKITNVGIVAGSYVLDGKVTRNGQVRIVRDGIIVGDDKIAGLQRFKDSVKEVAAGRSAPRRCFPTRREPHTGRFYG